MANNQQLFSRDAAERLIRQTLRDIQVELDGEFDRNFERQGFFSEKWARRTSPIRPGRPILVDTGALRRSIGGSTISGSKVTWESTLPYAAIHNEGGEIRVTAKMKRFFWAKMYEAEGAFGRKKNGEKRNDKRNARLTTEAEFWRAMALKKVDSIIEIPKRQFLGSSAEVERLVREIIEENLSHLGD
jgi:phage gpG-like protein